jgi:hypothetical protein
MRGNVASASKSEDCPPEETVDRVLERWEKGGNGVFLAEEALRGITVEELRVLFATGGDNDPCMFNQYLVGERQVSRLSGAVSGKIDIAAYDYFVCAYQRGGNDS